MIAETDKAGILECAKKYDVSVVYLFGSSIEPEADAHDIDVAVKGLAPEHLFRFYGELVQRLSKPVDLVDLSKETTFNKLVEELGVRIYGY
jgi:predicted nucleotidyltransferase